MSSLISVNVGLPTNVEWQGRSVRTAVWKKPVLGRVMARHLNLDGDGQGDLAGHGGENRAVMVYQLDSYRYWQKYLQRAEFDYGQFGENFTVEGLPDSEVCIGDRYRIGGALFEVSQPRVTCYRVGLRMNEPQMPALLVSHHRPGFYFRVIEEGEVGAGDEIIKEAEGPERLTVSEIDALLYLPGHPVEKLESALRIPALSAGWHQSFEDLLTAESKNAQGGNAGVTDSKAPPPAWQGFRLLRICEIHQESVDVRSFIFESEDRSSLPASAPGQFLVLRLEVEKGSPPLSRSYSMSGANGTGTYRISVKRAEGAGSRYLHDRAKIGDLLEVSAPRGSFIVAPGTVPVALLSAGIGATPVISMLHWLVSEPANLLREIWWIYGARNGSEHPFAIEARKLIDSLPNGHSVIAYSNPEEHDRLGKDYDTLGHVNLSSLQSAKVSKHADFYLCGPTAFLAELSAGLRAWGVPQSCIHSETFGAGASMTPGIVNTGLKTPHQPSGPQGSGPKVSFTRSGLSVQWDPRFQNLLELAEACDVPVRWACRAGVCHTCETGLIDGTLRYAPEPLDPPAEGTALICCSTPLANLELDL
jgi:ferredoxin-NADP reductase/MOSC domain-containing protein YiiM